MVRLSSILRCAALCVVGVTVACGREPADRDLDGSASEPSDAGELDAIATEDVVRQDRTQPDERPDTDDAEEMDISDELDADVRPGDVDGSGTAEEPDTDVVMDSDSDPDPDSDPGDADGSSAGGGCDAGEFVSCSDGSTELRCAEDGVSLEERTCPVDRPVCSAGGCSAEPCIPGARSCDGDRVLECDSSGTERVEVETCMDGCAGGGCVDACGLASSSHVGCTFWAVDLDQFAVACRSSTPCSGGACLPSGYCDNTARDIASLVVVTNQSLRTVGVQALSAEGVELNRLSLLRGGTGTIELPVAAFDDTSLNREAVRLVADGPVSVQQFNTGRGTGFSSDASLLLPVRSVGTEYIVNGYPGLSATAPDVSPGKPNIAVIAVEPGMTTVTIASTAATLASGDGQIAAMTAGETRTFTLEYGDTLTLGGGSLAGTDFTGTRITSSRPVAVFSGSECSGVPAGVPFCDHLEEQLVPVSILGRRYVMAGFTQRGAEDTVWRFVATEDDTTLQTSPPLAGVDETTMQRGEFVEVVTNVNAVVTATAPISVASFIVGSSYPRPGQRCDRTSVFTSGGCAIPAACESGSGIGDPAFMLVVPSERFLSDYVVSTPEGYSANYLMIVAPASAAVTIDGEPAPAADSALADNVIIRAAVVPGRHRVRADVPFGLYLFGYACDTSYALPGGLDLQVATP